MGCRYVYVIFSKHFKQIGGFDEEYFMYYEDVDICVRLWNSGLRVVACPSISVVHDARRMSGKNLHYFKLHLSSLFGYLFKYFGRLPKNIN